MAGKDELKIRAGIEGVDEVGRAADKALSPWETKGRAAGKVLKDAFSSAASDMTRILTVSNAISFGKALDDARRYREEIGRLSVPAGPIGRLRGDIEWISKKTLLPEGEIIKAERGLGRITYNFRGAKDALIALNAEALDTGETLGDKLPLGATLMGALSTKGEDVGHELGRIRALAEDLGTEGGTQAVHDRLVAIKDVLGQISTKTDEDKAKIEALAAGLGKGFGAEGGKRVAAGLISHVTGNARGYERFLNMRPGESLDEHGRVADPLAMLEKAQQKLLRLAGGDKGRARFIAGQTLGHETAAGLFSADFAAIRAAAASGRRSHVAEKQADDFSASEAGQAEARRLEQERKAREAAEKLLPVADAAQGFFAEHPLLGPLVAHAGLKVAGHYAGSLFGGGAASGGGGALAGAPTALPGAAGAGGIFAPVMSAAALPLLAQLGYGAAWVNEAGELAAARPQIEGEMTGMFAGRRRRDARNIVRAAAESGGTPEGFAAALGPGLLARAGYDPALQSVASGLVEGKVDLSSLPSEVRQGVIDGLKELTPTLREALQGVIQIQTDPDNPVTANTAQQGRTIRND